MLIPPLALQNEPYAGPEYIDAWSNLDAGELRALSADYLHLTADAAETIQKLGIDISGRGGFRLVHDTFNSPTPASRHRVYSIVDPSLGDASGGIAGLSSRLTPDASILLGDGISEHATAALAYELRDFTLIRNLEIPGHLRVPFVIEPPGSPPITRCYRTGTGLWNSGSLRIRPHGTELTYAYTTSTPRSRGEAQFVAIGRQLNRNPTPR